MKSAPAKAETPGSTCSVMTCPLFFADNPQIDRSDSNTVVLRYGEDRLITFDSQQAVEHRMATAVVEDLDEALALAGIKDHTRIDLKPSEQEYTARALAQWSPLLAGLALILIMFELKTPGVGLFAILGALCGIGFLFTQYYLDMVSNIEIVIIGIGALLVAIELTTFAGGGLLALAGYCLAEPDSLWHFYPMESPSSLMNLRLL